jgi:protein-disulfide isomerase
MVVAPAMALAALAMVTGMGWAAEPVGAAIAQDQSVIRFFERALPWYPDGKIEIVQDEVRGTAAGTYRLVTVERSCDEQMLAGRYSVLIDQVTSWACLGSVGRLPVDSVAQRNLRGLLEELLPVALEESMKLKARVEWGDAYGPEGAVIPLTLQVSTGYGEYRKAAAVSADGSFLAMGEALRFDEDPVAFRRSLLRSEDLVIWDHGSGSAAVEIVEFSDFQCPGCKIKWDLVKTAVERYGGSIRHGMVAFPLTKHHPWAFRSACASWCVGQQSPEMVLPMKELFYSLQSEMSVGEVTPTAKDFVEGNGLSPDEFSQCYLRPPSLNAVHDQISLGQRLGVNATPTYFINGWKVQAPDKTWLFSMIEKQISEAAR